MPVSCVPQDLITAAAPFQVVGGFENEVIIYLLAQISGGSTDPNVLLQQAACMECIPAGAQPEVIISLLCQIVNNGGAGGSGAPDSINYAGPPILNPPALQNIVVDSNGQQWMYYAAAWH